MNEHEHELELLKKKENENYCQYVWRVDQGIRNGTLSSWADVTPIVNEQLWGENYDMYRGESAYRKDVASARKFFDAGIFNLHYTGNANVQEQENPAIDKLKQEQENLFKLKKQFYDQRREYNKLLIADSRFEHIKTELVKCAESMQPLVYDFEPVFKHSDTEREAVLVWSDWHYGMVTDNIWNRFNTDICKERIKILIEKTIEYVKMYGIDTLNIVSLGDAFHGAIHVTCRIAAEEDACDQLMHVSEIMAECINELSKHVNKINYYSCYGNHGRTIQNKNESMHSDNMEKIIPWWISQRLKNNPKVQVYESEYKEFTFFSVLGFNICAVHGDLDNIKNAGQIINTLYNKKFGKTIHYVLLGDKHHLEEFESFGIESVIVRSLCGADDYANAKRLYSMPGQTLLIFNKDEGKECTRNIVFK